MPENDLCQKCFNNDQCETDCPALMALSQIAQQQQSEEKTALIKDFAKEIGLIKFEIAPDLAALGQAVLNHFSEFDFVRNAGVRIGYIKSYTNKNSNGKSILAECRIIKGVYTAYLPYDFIITFFWPSIHAMTDNQIKLIMLHELKHIGLNHKGYYLVPHDIEDFSDILSKYGLAWNKPNNSTIPDILEINAEM